MFRGLNNFQPMFNNDRNVFEWLFTESKSNEKITNILHKETFTVFEPIQKLKTFYYALYVTFFLSVFFSLDRLFLLRHHLHFDYHRNNKLN